MELDYDLDSKIKYIEEEQVSKEVERDRQIDEMKEFLETSAQSFNSKIQNLAYGTQTSIGKPSKDGKDVASTDY